MKRVPKRFAAGLVERLVSADAKPVVATANADTGEIDCVWYGGQAVPRIDQSTGEPYMLSMAMSGCRMERLNAGAPVFDTHFTGDDWKSLIAGMVGTKAQIGVVRKAWTDGTRGLGTIQFDMGSPDGAEAFRKASSGILQNLSFGTWIYERERNEMQDPDEEQPEQYTATDWEPFEIGPCTVPADFTTTFLSAALAGVGRRRATGPTEEHMSGVNGSPGAGPGRTKRP